MNSLAGVLFICGLGASLYGAVGILAIKPRSRAQFFAAVLLLLAAIGMIPPYIFTINPKTFLESQSLISILVWTQYLLGPTLLTYVISLPEPTLSGRWPTLPPQTRIPRIVFIFYWLVPAAALLFLPVLLFPFSKVHFPFAEFLHWYAAGSVLSLFIMSSHSLRLTYRNTGKESPVTRKPLTNPLSLFLLLLSADLLIVLIGMNVYPMAAQAGNLFAVILIIGFGLLLQRRPTMIGIRHIPFNSQVRREFVSNEMEERLDSFMVQEQPYLDEDLSRARLAQMLEVSEKTLTAIIHDRKGMNFNNYLNHLRIKEARRLLSEIPNRSILNVTYACGFNSRSAFYEAFKRETGLSPGEYRRARTE